MFREKRGIRYRRRCKKITPFAILTVILIFLIGGIWGFRKKRIPEVILKVQDVSMLQDEEIPQIRAKASCKEEKYNKIVILLKENSKKKYYQIEKKQ